jgi:hypothetical protein
VQAGATQIQQTFTRFSKPLKVHALRQALQLARRTVNLRQRRPLFGEQPHLVTDRSCVTQQGPPPRTPSRGEPDTPKASAIVLGKTTVFGFAMPQRRRNGASDRCQCEAASIPCVAGLQSDGCHAVARRTTFMRRRHMTATPAEGLCKRKSKSSCYLRRTAWWSSGRRIAATAGRYPT